jgi:hydroxymethylglutaryl-CoA lyase
MFELMEVETGIDLPALLDLSSKLSALVGGDVPGQVVKAGRRCDLHPLPLEARERLSTGVGWSQS